MPSSPAIAVGRDEQLALLLDAITQKQLDVDTACSQHPDLAEELRHLLVIGQMVDFCAQPRQEPQPPVPRTC